MSNKSTYRSIKSNSSIPAFESLESRQLCTASVIAGATIGKVPTAALTVSTYVNTKLPGTVDPSYGTNGVAQTPFGFQANATAVQPDGKIVLVGQINGQFAVARENANGTPDSSFGINGLVITDVGAADGQSAVTQGDTFDNATAVSVQSDGKILVAGTVGEFVDTYVALARYNTDGTLDKTFGHENGTELTLDNVANDISAIAQRSDGTIVFAGDALDSHYSSLRGSSYDLFLGAVESNGGADFDFGNRSLGTLYFDRSGYNTVDLDGYNSTTTAMVIIPDNGIILAAHSVGPDGDVADDLVRFNSDGTVADGSVGSNSVDLLGLPPTTINYASSHLTGLTLDGDAMVATGTFYVASSHSTYVFADRYLFNGSLDTSLNGTGYASQLISLPGFTTSGATVNPQGDITVFGTATSANPTETAEIVAMQFNSAGQFDTKFGTKGVFTEILGNSVSFAGAGFVANGDIIIAANTDKNAGTTLVQMHEQTPSVSITTLDGSATESSNNANPGSFIVTRDARYDFPTRVYITTSGTASASTDYTSTASIHGYIDIPAGESYVVVPVDMLNQSAFAGSRTATFTLSTEPTYISGTSTSASVKITGAGLAHVGPLNSVTSASVALHAFDVVVNTPSSPIESSSLESLLNDVPVSELGLFSGKLIN